MNNSKFVEFWSLSEIIFLNKLIQCLSSSKHSLNISSGDYMWLIICLNLKRQIWESPKSTIHEIVLRLILPFYRWENCGSERLTALPKCIQSVSDSAICPLVQHSFSTLLNCHPVKSLLAFFENIGNSFFLFTVDNLLLAYIFSLVKAYSWAK